MLRSIQHFVLAAISCLLLAFPLAALLWLLSGFVSYALTGFAQFLFLPRLAYGISHFNKHRLVYVNLYVIAVALISVTDFHAVYRYKKIVKKRRARGLAR